MNEIQKLKIAIDEIRYLLTDDEIISIYHNGFGYNFDHFMQSDTSFIEFFNNYRSIMHMKGFFDYCKYLPEFQGKNSKKETIYRTAYQILHTPRPNDKMKDFAGSMFVQYICWEIGSQLENENMQ